LHNYGFGPTHCEDLLKWILKKFILPFLSFILFTMNFRSLYIFSRNFKSRNENLEKEKVWNTIGPLFGPRPRDWHGPWQRMAQGVSTGSAERDHHTRAHPAAAW
jgi:hypothetical protein